jgi:hypothetical protein
MSIEGTKPRERVLDPIERLSEVLFGLIMVLSFTCTISVIDAGEGDVREMVIAALGCNLAWGIVDAVMYLMTITFDRGRGLAIARAVCATPDPQRGRELLSEVLPEPLDQLFDGPALEHARARLLALPTLPARPRLRKRDWLGALGVFLLVFVSTFPVVVPFLLFEPLHRALRISNGVAIALLFVAGMTLGSYAGIGRVRTGLAMVAIGVVLLGITIALGG